jgi:predicted O-linked N-acetylglucosamine transferase (SPINDLY family)
LRLTYHARLGPAAFWNLYAVTDIALDSFPCNGGTTTFETLWMGVPVIALAGAGILVSHVSAGILRGLGLDELIGSDVNDYVLRAAALAQDLPRLAQLRAGLRDRMSDSAYLDHQGFVVDLERAYRAMWQRWCAQQMEPTQ